MFSSSSFALPGGREPSAIYAFELKAASAGTIASELVGARRIDQPAPTSDVETFDVDWTTAPRLPEVETHARLEVPGGTRGAFGSGASASARPTTYDSRGRLFTGSSKAQPRSADGASYDISVQSLPLYPGADPYVTYELAGLAGGFGSSVVVKDGLAKDGEIVSGFLSPPVVSAATVRGFKDGASVRVVAAPDGATVRLTFFVGEELVWTLDTTSDVTEVRVPSLPASTGALRSQIGEGRLQFMADIDPTRGVYAKTATSNRIVVRY